MASSERYLLVPDLRARDPRGDGRRRRRPAHAPPRGARRLPRRGPLAPAGDPHATSTPPSRDSATAHARYESARALVELPGVGEALDAARRYRCRPGKMRHWFGFYSGRPPEDFVSDGKGRTRPDIYLAPANAKVAKAVLTRERFDDDASFRVPPGLHPVRRNSDWVLYAAHRLRLHERPALDAPSQQSRVTADQRRPSCSVRGPAAAGLRHVVEHERPDARRAPAPGSPTPRRGRARGSRTGGGSPPTRRTRTGARRRPRGIAAARRAGRSRIASRSFRNARRSRTSPMSRGAPRASSASATHPTACHARRRPSPRPAPSTPPQRAHRTARA